jgi:hypothetical protein
LSFFTEVSSAISNRGSGYGAVFKLTYAGEESVFYSFGSQPGDGVSSYAGVVSREILAETQCESSTTI